MIYLKVILIRVRSLQILIVIIEKFWDSAISYDLMSRVVSNNGLAYALNLN